MRSGLIMHWLRSAAGRGFAGALLLALPVAVAGTIGFGEGIRGLGAAFGNFPGGESFEAAQADDSTPGPEAIVLPLASPAPGGGPGAAFPPGQAPGAPGDTGAPGGIGDQVPADEGGGGGVPALPPATPGPETPSVPSVDVGSSVSTPGPIRQILRSVTETVQAVQTALGSKSG